MPIENDGTFETNDQVISAFEDLLKKETDAETPSGKESDDEGKPEADEAEETEEASDDEAQDETEDNESSSEDDEGDEGETDKDKDKPKSKKYADDDETYVKVKVGDEEHEVPVKDLKRLFGQEASLTKKSQEVAAKTKLAEDNSAKALAALDVMVKRAQEASKPYRELNWAALMKDPNISADELQGLQNLAKAAIDNETFLTGQMDQFMNHIRQEQANAHRTAAQEAIKALTTEGSPHHVKGWNNELYNDIREFAVGQGLDRSMVNQLTDPAAFKMLHMAMQFHKGSKKVVVTKKVDKSPKRIVKSSTTNSGPSKDTSKLVARKQALAQQKKAGGNMQSTEDAFFALLGGE